MAQQNSNKDQSSKNMNKDQSTQQKGQSKDKGMGTKQGQRSNADESEDME